MKQNHVNTGKRKHRNRREGGGAGKRRRGGVSPTTHLQQLRGVGGGAVRRRGVGRQHEAAREAHSGAVGERGVVAAVRGIPGERERERRG